MFKCYYTEDHHIIPQSLGGSDEKSNLVTVTGREHALCHWLLLKMTEGEDYEKMSYAFNFMGSENEFQQRYHSRIITRAYQRHRIKHAHLHSKRMKGKTPANKGKKMSEEQKQLLRERAKANHASGKVYSEESQQKRIAKVTGQKRTKETRKKMSLASKGKPKGPMSEEQKLKRSITMTGQKKKSGHADKVRAAVLGNVSINKDGIEKKVKRDTLDEWLKQGWLPGGRKRLSVG